MFSQGTEKEPKTNYQHNQAGGVGGRSRASPLGVEKIASSNETCGGGRGLCSAQSVVAPPKKSQKQTKKKNQMKNSKKF